MIEEARRLRFGDNTAENMCVVHHELTQRVNYLHKRLVNAARNRLGSGPEGCADGTCLYPTRHRCLRRGLTTSKTGNDRSPPSFFFAKRHSTRG